MLLLLLPAPKLYLLLCAPCGTHGYASFLAVFLFWQCAFWLRPMAPPLARYAMGGRNEFIVFPAAPLLADLAMFTRMRQ